MIGQDSLAANSLAARRACDELSRRLRAGLACRAEEFLAAEPSIRLDTDAALELLYTEFIVREQLGQQPEIEEWLRRFPQWHKELAELFEIHSVVEHRGTQRIGPTGTQIEDSSPASSIDLPRAEFVQGYTLLAEIGRGGMGVVYRARQRGLERIVALKMMLSPHGERERARFRTEAEATARLSHPNIVQIFEVGQDGDRPFLSMEFVAGKSLDKQFTVSTLAPRAAAEMLLTLARAVAYAHEQGIIHRDLKPGNIVLAADGTPKITDFGLARQFLSPDAQNRKPSEGPPSVAIVGTPSYMAPEQCRPSSRVGPASDVYALGAILYEALTGRPPFRGETALDIWELVRSQEPIPPRQLAPKVPRDLETICLKCLAKQPEQRYASALGLAEDLKRFLEGEPISARPVGRAERAVRWCRRNPVVAMLSGGIALALVCGTVISTTLAVWALSEKNRAAMHARQAGANAQQAQAARELAEYRFTQAEKAVEEYLDGIESNARLKEADFLDLRKQLLTSAVPFYEEFVRQKPNDAALEAKRGRAYGRLGQLRGHLGEHQRAESDIRQMMAIFQKLAADFPGFAEYRQQEARAQHSLSILLYESGKQEDALAEIRRAVALEQQLIAAAPSSNAYRQDLARSRAMLGMLLHGLGSHDAAVAEYQKVFALEQPLADEFPKNPAYRVDLARSHNNLASVLEALGKRPESVDEMRKALSLGQELSAEFPRVPAYRQDLVRSHYNLAALFTRLRQWPQAEVEHRQSITLGKSLVEEFPTVPAYRADLARSHYNLGRMLRDRGRLGEAEVEYREALTLRAKLNADVSGIAEYRANLAQSHAGMGSVFGALGKRADAIAELQRAAEVWTPLLQGFPDRLEYRTSMASHLNSLALFLREDGKLDEARLMHNVAIEHCLVVFKAAPKKRTYAASLSGYYRELGDTALLQKDHAQVAESAHQLAQTRSDIAADAVLAARFLGRCVTLAEHDEQLTADERQLLANSYADQAVAHLREAIRRGYKNVASLKDLAALAPLRDRADFQQLLQELSAQ